MKKFISLLLSLLFLLSFVPFQSKASAAADYKAATVNTQSGNLNVRSSPSASSYIKTSIPKGSFVTLISENGNFRYVRYGKSSYGYCHKDYIKTVSDKNATVNTSSGNLNVRTGEGTNFSIKDKLPKGENVVILSSSGNWVKILYHGNKTGFVSSSYLKTASNTYSSIYLNVPSFKQTDSRWGYVTLGSSGKTIAKIGCATTAISMIESFRKGYNIYPDTMSKRLSYTSSGSVYWPSDYKVTTSSSNYLKAFYELLKQGKPVLFGSKNYYGSQHWIVVTGFRGGELTASNFIINDPGSNSRITLSQFISSYPQFYKYFSY
ncbi:MAG: SH3 domain-containing protein [Clostridia bacterium]|nr:SH3 domain-containing protein [Clostridia bacterium]